MSMRSLGAAQGAPGNVAEPDALSGLIAALSDPKATAAKLQEIKDVLAVNEQAIEKLAIRQAELDARALELQKAATDIHNQVEALDKREAAIQAKEVDLVKREQMHHSNLAKLDEDRAALAAAQKKTTDEAASIRSQLGLREADLDTREAGLTKRALDLDEKQATLDAAESGFADRIAEHEAARAELQAVLARV